MNLPANTIFKVNDDIMVISPSGRITINCREVNVNMHTLCILVDLYRIDFCIDNQLKILSAQGYYD